MATFRMGQRVRVVAACQWLKKYIGTEGTIIGVGSMRCDNGCTTSYGLDITIDGKHPHGCPCTLEPTYDGNETVSWSTCEWMPEHLRTTV